MRTIKSKWVVIGGGLFLRVGVPSIIIAVPLFSWVAGYHAGMRNDYFPNPTPTTTILVYPSELP
jgi:hypothetical protein